jgi:hypothetical protein
MDKLLNPIPLIPPIIILVSTPLINEPPHWSHEPIDISITKLLVEEVVLNPLAQEIPSTLKPLLVTPTFYKTPRKVLKESILPARK